jgi:putative IMPACT (imprinted ancient) family translation regulator
LAVLRGSGLGDVAVVVTRYFGGTKLGTGGLVRAYGDAVREVLAITPRAAKVPIHIVVVPAPYHLYEQIRRLIAAHRGQISDEDFGADVMLTARFAVDDLPPFQDGLGELSNGTLQAEIIETNQATIMPIEIMADAPENDQTGA